MRYIRYKDKYKNDVKNLMSKGFNSKTSEEEFDWFHFGNPLAPSNIVLAMDEERVVGFHSVVKKRISINKKGFCVGRDSNPVVDPDYRRKGVFSNLLKFMLEDFNDVDLYFNFANDKSAPGFLKNGWIQVNYEAMNYWVAEFSFSKKYLGSILSQFLNRTKQIVGSVEEIIDFEEFEFFPSSDTEFLIQIIKDKEYMLWRYFNNPSKKYRFFKILQKESILGLIICHFYNGRCTIEDIYNQSVLQNVELLALLFKYFKKKKYNLTIQTWNTTGRYLDKLMIRSIKKNKYPFYVRPGIGRNFDIDVFDPSNWFLSPGEV